MKTSGDETVVARVRPHSRALFFPTVLLLAVAAAVGFFSGRFAEPWQNIAVLAAAGILLFVGWLVPMLRWLSTNYTITSRRIVVRGGIVVRYRQELMYGRAHDVTVRRGALQSVFRSGDVILNAGAESPVVLRDVPSATLVQAALHDLIDAYQLDDHLIDA